MAEPTHPDPGHYCHNAHAIKTLEEDRDEIVRRMNALIQERADDRVKAAEMAGQIALLCQRVPADLGTVLSEIRTEQKAHAKFRDAVYKLAGAVVTAIVLAFVAFALGGGLKVPR